MLVSDAVLLKAVEGADGSEASESLAEAGGSGAGSVEELTSGADGRAVVEEEVSETGRAELLSFPGAGLVDTAVVPVGEAAVSAANTFPYRSSARSASSSTARTVKDKITPERSKDWR